MRLWMQRYGSAWCFASLVGLVAGCGGSSSETPEPARPESWQLKLRHRQQVSASDIEAPTRSIDRDGLRSPTPARSTWGNEGTKQSARFSTKLQEPREADQPMPSPALPKPTLDSEGAVVTPPKPSGSRPAQGKAPARGTVDTATSPEANSHDAKATKALSGDSAPKAKANGGNAIAPEAPSGDSAPKAKANGGDAMAPKAKANGGDAMAPKAQSGESAPKAKANGGNAIAPKTKAPATKSER